MPVGGWEPPGVDVPGRGFVGDSASGVGVAVEDGGFGNADTGSSWTPPVTVCVLSSDTGTAQPSAALEGLSASGA